MKQPLLLVLIFAALFSGLNAKGQKLTIVIEGLRNDKGQVLLDFYQDSERFKKEVPAFTLTYAKAGNINNGTMVVEGVELAKGTYGIALVDDENSNGRLDFRLIIPREGFAFSNHPFTHHRKPDFEAFSFEHTDGSVVRIEVYYFTGHK
jgi:uncharacterized protein (DUF2141 family)